MSTRVFATISLVAAALTVVGCNSDRADESVGTEAAGVTGIQLALTSMGPSGTEYRLAPASFSVQQVGSTEPALLVDASPDERTAIVPLSAGDYSIVLQPGWQLNRISSGGGLAPIPATLVGPSEIQASVHPFETAPVTFRFHSGESQLAVGVQVDEDPSSYSDGYIGGVGVGRYEIRFFNGAGSVCCFSSVEQARAAYPGLLLDAP
jgi:hypothetical protein